MEKLTGGHPLFRQTVVEIKPSQTLINRADEMFWMGSCFVQTMEPFLSRFRFSAIVNPFGVVFHPSVMARLLEMDSDEILEKSFENQSVWKNYWLASTFAGTREALFESVKKATLLRDSHLKKSNWLVLTLGTSFLYEHHQLGMVGKCHKQPTGLFEKKRSTVSEIHQMLKSGIDNHRRFNPGLKVILTVSPVRHTRDGLEENSVSKSILRLACDLLCKELNHVFYFPAFEIIMDELRDYRFFGPDLVHPNEEAVAYIWSRFEKQFFSEETIKTNRLLQGYFDLSTHKPMVGFGLEHDRWNQNRSHLSQQISERIVKGF